MTQTVIHSFGTSLRQSEEGSLQPFWNAVYREAFCDMVACVSLRGNTQSQRQGKDRAIHLANGRVIYIDEKVRPDRMDDSDILLEYRHEGCYNAPGWMEEDKNIDYIAYGFILLQRVYLLPWLDLRRAWLQHKETWIKTYKTIKATNNGIGGGKYVTSSVAVPTKLLRGAVAGAGKIQL